MKNARIGMGTATLVVIFAVLSMTVLSLLTLLTARNERALAQRTAETVKQYYVTDTNAMHIRRALEQSWQAGNPLPETVKGVSVQTQGDTARYSCPMAGGMEIAVTLGLLPDGNVEVRAWQTIPGEWELDTRLLVWDGEGGT